MFSQPSEKSLTVRMLLLMEAHSYGLRARTHDCLGCKSGTLYMLLYIHTFYIHDSQL